MPGVRARWVRLLRESERGSSAVELVIAVPVLLLLIFSIIQFTLVWHAEQVAQDAASQALAAARIQGGSQDTGQAQAEKVLDQVAGGSLRTHSVSVQRGAMQVQVQVTGTAESILPFITLHVHAEADGPVERTSAP
jgi:Flp pilus assembly protein TadG